ncbi:hypothetical protein DRP53_10440 [candidate division WOR-3 bacterium]|uniref:Bacterial transcriptional activator domain-containing protein n=1 Tax=candidate division WOR-3 bacterium TaxID=2052148 RepID=A0A660SEZ7_UNCW3|nr:MAG: hypothetical protein DRP53_10440 [candidate division WOR-3 bacterium]
MINTEKGGATWGEYALQLWPDFTTKEARNNFHFTLSYLKKMIVSGFIISRRNLYLLNRDLARSDIWEFEECYRRFKEARIEQKIHKAEIYALDMILKGKGDFLPEFRSEAIEAKRWEIENRLEEVLLWLATRHLDKLEYNEAINFARLVINRTPLSERAYRIIIRSYLEQGERARAFQYYERLRILLKQEFGVEPSPETKRLISAIKKSN